MNRTTFYWITTAITAFVMLSGGIFGIFLVSATVDGVRALGYPTYFVAILGFWKILGSIAILMPRLPRLKEWAYAGIFLELSGGAVSHVVCGDPVGKMIAPALFAILALVSWALRPASRRLGDVL